MKMFFRSAVRVSLLDILTRRPGRYNERWKEASADVQKQSYKKKLSRPFPARDLEAPAGSLPQSATRTPRRRVWLVAGGLAVAAAVALAAAFAMRSSPPPVYRCQVLAEYPHSADAFTQGLVYEDGVLYEGTGGYGASWLRRVELKTGKVIQQVALEEKFFGEGITIVGDEIYQLTWRSRVGFVYDKTTFRKLREFTYTGEGWGLTYDGQHLILSDGTETLRFFEPRTFQEARRLQVTSAGQRLRQLNELEYADGFIYANIWYSEYIVKISPQTGEVVAWFDLRRLIPREVRRNREAVLNGIAYDPRSGQFFVTGKNWPRLFAVRLAESAQGE